MSRANTVIASLASTNQRPLISVHLQASSRRRAMNDAVPEVHSAFCLSTSHFKRRQRRYGHSTLWTLDVTDTQCTGFPLHKLGRWVATQAKALQFTNPTTVEYSNRLLTIQSHSCGTAAVDRVIRGFAQPPAAITCGVFASPTTVDRVCSTNPACTNLEQETTEVS